MCEYNKELAKKTKYIMGVYDEIYHHIIQKSIDQASITQLERCAYTRDINEIQNASVTLTSAMITAGMFGDIAEDVGTSDGAEDDGK